MAIIKESMHTLKQSFKSINKKTGIDSLFDIGLILYVYLAFQIWVMLVTSQVLTISGFNLLNIFTATKEQINAAYWKLLLLVIIVIGGIIIAFVGFALLYSIFKYFTFTRLYNAKRTTKRILKFFLLNLIWMSMLAVPFAYLVIRYREYFAQNRGMVLLLFLALFILFIHFTGLMHYYFFKEDKKQIIKAFQGAFYHSFKRFHIIIAWEAFLLFLLAVMLAVSYALNLGILFLLILLSFLLYFAFSRVLMSRIYERYVLTIQEKESLAKS